MPGSGSKLAQSNSNMAIPTPLSDSVAAVPASVSSVPYSIVGAPPAEAAWPSAGSTMTAAIPKSASRALASGMTVRQRPPACRRICFRGMGRKLPGFSVRG